MVSCFGVNASGSIRHGGFGGLYDASYSKVQTSLDRESIDVFNDDCVGSYPFEDLLANFECPHLRYGVLFVAVSDDLCGWWNAHY